MTQLWTTHYSVTKSVNTDAAHCRLPFAFHYLPKSSLLYLKPVKPEMEPWQPHMHSASKSLEKQEIDPHLTMSLHMKTTTKPLLMTNMFKLITCGVLLVIT